MNGASVESFLQVLSLLFDIVLVVRLLTTGLFRKYPFFFGMLCPPLILQTLIVRFGTQSQWFSRPYMGLEPIRNVLFVLVVYELFSVIFRNYAGLRSLSRWVMGVAAAIAALGFALAMAPSGRGNAIHDYRLLAIVRVERSVTFGLVIFIIIMLYFISRYPIKLPRNSVVLCVVYSIWFLGDSAVLLVMTFLPHSYFHYENDALALLEIASYVSWAMLLSKAGETQEIRVRTHLSREREERLIGELETINKALVRAGQSVSHSH